MLNTLISTGSGWRLVTNGTSAQSFGDGPRRWMTFEGNGDGLPFDDGPVLGQKV